MKAPKITVNIIIIDMIMQYIVEKEILESCYDEINYTRLQKKIIIPAELVGYWGVKRIESFDHNKRGSILK